MYMKKFVVAGIGTGIGKTLASAVIVEALQADYWKPVQSGSLDDTDTDAVRRLVSNPRSGFHHERFRLSEPLSPHIAAAMEGIEITPKQLQLPATDNHLIIETAGGLLSPLSKTFFNIDLPALWDLPVLLVSQNYLGSINHTLLSVEALKARQIKIAGIIFNGEETPASEEMIIGHTGLPHLGRIPRLRMPDAESVRQVAASFKPKLEKL